MHDFKHWLNTLKLELREPHTPDHEPFAKRRAGYMRRTTRRFHIMRDTRHHRR